MFTRTRRTGAPHDVQGGRNHQQEKQKARENKDAFIALRRHFFDEAKFGKDLEKSALASVVLPNEYRNHPSGSGQILSALHSFL
jgi:hypothetical protein